MSETPLSPPNPPLLVSASSKNNSSMRFDLNYLTAPCSFSILAARCSSLASHGNLVNEPLLELRFFVATEITTRSLVAILISSLLTRSGGMQAFSPQFILHPSHSPYV